METPSVRILVVGDSGVGKTTLLRSLCRLHSPHSIDQETPPTCWTTGCDVHVLLQVLEPHGHEVFVEFLDVGGHRKYERSRGAFYHNVHGMLLVHDVSNAKSGEHLRNWYKEVQDMQKRKACVVPPTGKVQDVPTLTDLPKLVVGNKKDLKGERMNAMVTGGSGVAEFQSIACIESRADPLTMEPSGIFETFLHQTVAFANRDGSVRGTTCHMGGRPTNRVAGTLEGSGTRLASRGVRSRWW